MELATVFNNEEDFTTAIDFDSYTMNLDENDGIEAIYEEFEDLYEIYINGDMVLSTPYAKEAMIKWNETVEYYK